MGVGAQVCGSAARIYECSCRRNRHVRERERERDGEYRDYIIGGVWFGLGKYE